MKRCSMYLIMVSTIFCNAAEKKHELVPLLREKAARHDELIIPHYNNLREGIENQSFCSVSQDVKYILDNKGRTVLIGVLKHASENKENLSEIAKNMIGKPSPHSPSYTPNSIYEYIGMGIVGTLTIGFIGGLIGTPLTANVLNILGGTWSLSSWATNTKINHDFYHSNRWIANNCSAQFPNCQIQAPSCFTDQAFYLGVATATAFTGWTAWAARCLVRRCKNSFSATNKQINAAEILTYIQNLEDEYVVKNKKGNK
ncbi:MAG TPA: hypothetical protein VEK38_01870 [Candidatus Bathyarchaeia archaeon]|nr:hypothetical protein [Candidatus Bathyarchaeia archaeon]